MEFGILRWRYETGWSVYSSPAVVAGVVYVGSVDNYVYALDAGAIDSRLRMTWGVCGNDEQGRGDDVMMGAGMTNRATGMVAGVLRE